MAAINGTTGSVSLQVGGGEVFLHIDRWSVQAPREMHNVTTFDSDGDWNDMAPGLVKWTGSIEGFYQDAAESPLDESDLSSDTATLVLTASTGRTYTWTALATIRDVTMDVGVGVPSRWTAAFTGNGSPTIT